MRALANLFAIRVPGEANRQEVRARMVDLECFDEIEEPVACWLVGVERFRGSDVDGPDVRREALYFVEGRECVDGWVREHVSSPRDVARWVAQDPRRLGEIGGDFGFVHFDADVVRVVRSAAGLVPFFLHHDERSGSIAVSTRLVYFHRILGEGLAPDPLVHASWTDGVVLPELRTPIAGVSRVPAGHVAQLHAHGRKRLYTYWDPTHIAVEPATPASERAHSEELNSLLLEGLEQDLHPERANLVGLSGGVDSSALAALASNVLGLPLTSFSMLPARGHPQLREVESFVDVISGAVRPRADRRYYFADLDFLDIYRTSPRLGIPVPHPALTLLQQLLADDDEIDVYTGGELADDLFGGPFVLRHDWLTSFGPVDLVRAALARELPGSRKRTMKRWVGNRVRQAVGRPHLPYRHELPMFVHADLRSEYEAWVEAQQRDMSTLPGPYRTLEMTRRADGWVLQNWEVCSELGVRRSLPFYRRAVMELAYRCSPREHALPPKNLLRLGLNGLVPDENLHRPDKGTADALVESTHWMGPLPDSLSTIVRAEWMDGPGEIALNDAESLCCLIASTEDVQHPRRRSR